MVKQTKKNKLQPKNKGKRKKRGSSKHKSNKLFRYEKKKKNKVNKKKKISIYKIGVAFIFACLLYFFFFVIFFSVGRMNGYSMMPTLNDKDKVIVSKRTGIKRFDLVYIKVPEQKNGYSIRRVVGLPGDNLEYRNDELIINNEMKSEKFLNNKKKSMNSMILTDDFTLKEVTNQDEIPKNSYFVLGDNRKSSTDSRFYGVISESDIVGKVETRIFPLSKFEIY